MHRDYRIERDAIIRRWYGGNPESRNSRRNRRWDRNPISPNDCLGIPIQVNPPFHHYEPCMVWKYSLNQDGYGTLSVDGKAELAHRVVYIQTRGEIPEGKQINHLCNRPYCVQPSHLYAGTTQDNKDDSQIFTNPNLFTAPWVIGYPEELKTDKPLLQRLRETERYEDIDPWEPTTQPPQLPLEEFECPGHDFAITMWGGDSRICRVCETSEFQEEMALGLGTWELIQEICPASRTVSPIIEKIGQSEFLKESHESTRRKAYYRNRRGFGMGGHCIRDCTCRFCTQDRKTFREAIQPTLSPRESELLDLCDRTQPLIAKTLTDASMSVMNELATASGLDQERRETLRAHLQECGSSQTEMVKAIHWAEAIIAYFTHKRSQYQNPEQAMQEEEFQALWHITFFGRITQGNGETIENTLLPLATEAATAITERLQEEWRNTKEGYAPDTRDIDRFATNTARLCLTRTILEHLRHEMLGENSTHRGPPPHSGCLQDIIRTGRVIRFSNGFKEGIGYQPD